MASSTLRDNGNFWDGFSIEEAKGFLWQHDVGADHPSRKAAQEGIRKHFKGAKTLLEVPCASGAEYEALAKSWVLTCMDRTTVMLSALKSRYPEAQLLQGDIREIPAKDKTFDVVYARAIFEHLPSMEDVALAMKECVRVSKMGAVFSFFIPPKGEQRIDWNGVYFNNAYNISDVEAAISAAGAKSFVKEDVSVDGTSFVDAATVFYAKK